MPRKLVPRVKSVQSGRRSGAHLSAAAARLEVFIRLSELLTGYVELDRELAEAYFVRSADHLKPVFDQLLEQFHNLESPGRDPTERVRTDILAHPSLGPPARTLLMLWFTGGFLLPEQTWQMASAEQYYRALMWDAIGAHPPTLSNGYFGHWKYPVER